MKKDIKLFWTRRLQYFMTGFVISLICGAIQFNWIDIVPFEKFDQQPFWLRQTKDIIGWVPWIVCLLVLIFRIKRNANIRIGAFFLGTAMPTILMISWILFGITIQNAIHSKKFDSEEWKNTKITEFDEMWPPRLVMVDDLIENRKLDGLSKKEVIDMLGEPGNHGYFSQFDLVYWVGPERTFLSIDSEWLAISFNKDNIVNDYRLVRD